MLFPEPVDDSQYTNVHATLSIMPSHTHIKRQNKKPKRKMTAGNAMYKAGLLLTAS